MILITGATGLVGGETARLLMGKGISPRVVVRSDAASADPRWSGAHTVIADFDRPQSLDAALDGVEAALLVSPATPDMVRQQGAFVAAAMRVSRQRRPLRIVKVSGFLTALDSPARTGRWHAEIEAGIVAADLPVTCLRMPYFMQNLLWSEPTPIRSGVLRSPLPNARIAMLDARDIAAVAARCLLDEAHVGQRYYLTGPEAVSLADVASSLSEASGRPVRHDPDSLDEACAKLAAAGTPRWRIEVVKEFCWRFEGGAGEAVSDDVRVVTGTPPCPMDQFVRDHLAGLGG